MWGPADTDKPALDLKVESLRLQMYEGQHHALWFVIEAEMYDNETEEVRTENMVLPSYMLKSLCDYLPRFSDLFDKIRRG